VAELQTFLESPRAGESVREGAVELLMAPEHLAGSHRRDVAVYDAETEYIQVYHGHVRICVNLHQLTKMIRDWYKRNHGIMTFFGDSATKENQYAFVKRVWFGNPIVRKLKAEKHFSFVIDTLHETGLIARKEFDILHRTGMGALERLEGDKNGKHSEKNHGHHSVGEHGNHGKTKKHRHK